MSSHSGKDKRVWTPQEDEMLVQCLLELREKGQYVVENGFKPGYLVELERMMKRKDPDCTLLRNPNIQSRIKCMKTAVNAIHDLLNVSGFGWDPERKIVTADKEVWDDYVKVNKKAAAFRHKTFPQYEVLSTIFGKDRATGKDAQTFVDVLEDMDDHIIEEVADETDLGLDMDNISLGTSSLPESNPSEATSSSKKRKRNSTDRDELMLQGMERIATTLAQSFKESTENLGMHIDRVEREKRIDGMKEGLYDELMKVAGLSHDERLAAYVKMIADESILIGFYAMPHAGKVDDIRQIIS